MGKVPPIMYTDSDDEAGACTKAYKKKKSKSLKERLRGRSKSEPDETWRSRRSSRSSDATSRSSSRSSTPARPQLRGILKHTQHEHTYSPDEDEDEESSEQSRSRCLVGRVPPRAGGKLGRGGGLAFVIRRNPVNFPSNSGGRSMANKSSFKRLARKQSY